MQRCLELALNGRGSVSPNPMVGCVVVYNDRIIGEGWHREYGKAHAEVNAIASVSDQSLLPQSTLYVNLEPCTFFGKTPPCSDLIIEKKIKEVVMGSKDPNPKVSGSGIEKLKQAGVEVRSGILEKKSRELNRSFFKKFESGLPYIILKWAQSPDGFIAGMEGEQKKITNAKADVLVHKLRAEADGILVGANTIRNDNPELTTRKWKGSNPKVIVLSKSGSIPAASKILKEGAEILLTNADQESKGFKKTIKHSADDLKTPLNEISEYGIQNILVEGGAKTHAQFLRENLWDECWVFEGNEKLNQGIRAPELPKGLKIERNVRNNKLFIIVNSTSN